MCLSALLHKEAVREKEKKRASEWEIIFVCAPDRQTEAAVVHGERTLH